MGQRRRARECALQMLFQIDLTGVGAEEVFAQFWAGQAASDETRAFAQGLVLGVMRHRRSIDSVLTSSSEHWRVERMAVVDRNVLRMAVYEMLFHPETPAAVVIDEAIEVAKRFGGEESGAFVNGILDGIRKSVERGEISRPAAD